MLSPVEVNSVPVVVGDDSRKNTRMKIIIMRFPNLKYTLLVKTFVQSTIMSFAGDVHFSDINKWFLSMKLPAQIQCPKT